MNIKQYRKIFIILLCSITLTFIYAKKKHEIIPVEVFFEDEFYENPKISPDGTKIAFVGIYEGQRGTYIQLTDDASNITFVSNCCLRNSWWSYDNQSLFFLEANNGDRKFKLKQLLCSTGEIVNLTPYSDAIVLGISLSKEFPHKIAIVMNKDNKSAKDLFVLDLTTGNLECIWKNPGNVLGWCIDNAFVLRSCLQMNDDGRIMRFHRPQNDLEWQVLDTYGSEVHPNNCSIISYNNNGELYSIDPLDSDRTQLVKLNTTTGERTILAQDDSYDISPKLVVHPQTREPVFAFVQRKQKEIIVLDQDYAHDIDFLHKQLKGIIDIISYDDSFNKWIIQLSDSNLASEFYVYDRTTHDIKCIGYAQPKLRTKKLSKVEPFSFVARDGLPIEGHITYPTTTTSRNNLPIVLYVHGGPELRDTMNYCDPILQLIANRGYACVQINYRGSTGYGKAFMKASYKEYGRAMQHDLTDGIQYLIDQGIADPGRIAILGGSYGGYAALAGAAFTPDFYRCAIDLCGMSSLITYLESFPIHHKFLLVRSYARIGHIDTDRAMLEERSPLYHVDAIKIPLLIAHGANDPCVKKEESEQMITVLKEKGIPHEYLLFENEGHGLAHQENRIKFYQSMIKFIGKYL